MYYNQSDNKTRIHAAFEWINWGALNAYHFDEVSMQRIPNNWMEMPVREVLTQNGGDGAKLMDTILKAHKAEGQLDAWRDIKLKDLVIARGFVPLRQVPHRWQEQAEGHAAKVALGRPDIIAFAFDDPSTFDDTGVNGWGNGVRRFDPAAYKDMRKKGMARLSDTAPYYEPHVTYTLWDDWNENQTVLPTLETGYRDTWNSLILRSKMSGYVPDHKLLHDMIQQDRLLALHLFKVDRLEDLPADRRAVFDQADREIDSFVLPECRKGNAEWRDRYDSRKGAAIPVGTFATAGPMENSFYDPRVWSETEKKMVGTGRMKDTGARFRPVQRNGLSYIEVRSIGTRNMFLDASPAERLERANGGYQDDGYATVNRKYNFQDPGATGAPFNQKLLIWVDDVTAHTQPYIIISMKADSEFKGKAIEVRLQKGYNEIDFTQGEIGKRMEKSISNRDYHFTIQYGVRTNRGGSSKDASMVFQSVFVDSKDQASVDAFRAQHRDTAEKPPVLTGPRALTGTFLPVGDWDLQSWHTNRGALKLMADTPQFNERDQVIPEYDVAPLGVGRGYNSMNHLLRMLLHNDRYHLDTIICNNEYYRQLFIACGWEEVTSEYSVDPVIAERAKKGSGPITIWRKHNARPVDPNMHNPAASRGKSGLFGEPC
jgi:hypothetical protein